MSFTRAIRCASAALITPIVALLAVASGPATLPDTSGEGVVRHFIEVTGGADAYAKVKTRVTSGTIAMPNQGMNGDIAIFQKAPNLLRITGNVGGIVFDRGFDGNVAFEVNSMQGPRIIEGSEKDFMQLQSLANPLEKLGDYIKGIENLGVEQIEGRDAYKLEITMKTGEKVAQWYDTESGLLSQMQMSLDTAGGKLDILIGLSDWKDLDGVKVPSKMKQLIQPFGIEQNIEFTKLESGVEIPAEKFELPQEIKDLVQATAATQPSTTQSAATQPAGGK